MALHYPQIENQVLKWSTMCYRPQHLFEVIVCYASTLHSRREKSLLFLKQAMETLAFAIAVPSIWNILSQVITWLSPSPPSGPCLNVSLLSETFPGHSVSNCSPTPLLSSLCLLHSIYHPLTHYIFPQTF